MFAEIIEHTLIVVGLVVVIIGAAMHAGWIVF